MKIKLLVVGEKKVAFNLCGSGYGFLVLQNHTQKTKIKLNLFIILV